MDWPHQIQHHDFMLIGLVVLAFGVGALALSGWFFWRLARVRRRAKTAVVKLPRRPLMVFPPSTPGGQPQLHINGTLLGEPLLTAPATGRPCSIWELALAETIPASYDSNEGVNHLWVTSRCTDLTIECDARMVPKPQPTRGHRFDVTPGPFTVRLAGTQIQVPHANGTDPGLSYFRGGALPADPAALQRAGAPTHLLARVQARPNSFYLLEGSIAPGELVSLFQLTSVPGEVDPTAPAMLGVMGYEGDLPAKGSSMVGCLSTVFVIAGVACAAIGAIALIAGLVEILP